MKINIARIEEFLLTPAQQSALAALLAQAFPHYPQGATYFNQAPQFRLLAHTPDGALVGQMGVVHRWVSLDGRRLSVLGIMDLCVAPTHHQQGIGGQLLATIEDLARTSGQVDALLLTAEAPTFYVSQGFQVTHHKVKWLMVKDGQSWGIVHRTLPQCLLAKPIALDRWPTGNTLDCCGPMF